MPLTAEPLPNDDQRASRWFLTGALAAFSLPGLILTSAVLGFAGLAREAGFTMAEAVFMTGIIWALPAQVVLVGSVMSGASLPAAALAVTLSSVRLMPMVVALLPELRGPGSRRLALYGLSHFVAVTAWVLALDRFRYIPRPMRTSYFFGLGATLTSTNMVVVAIFYAVAGQLPPVVSAALLLLTPLYFLTSLWGSARERAAHVAMLAGLVLGPAFHLVTPQLDLLFAGVIGGGLAYAHHRVAPKTYAPKTRAR